MKKLIILTITIQFSIIVFGQWQQVSFPTSGISELRFDNINNLYFVRASYGVYKSSDFGNSSTNIQGGSIYSLEITDSLIFAGTNNGYIYLSKDRGNTFLPYSVSPNGINDILLKNGNVYVASYQAAVYASSDTCNTWTLYNQGFPTGSSPPNSVLAITCKDSIFLSFLYGAGVYLSTNNAQTWTSSDQPVLMGSSYCFSYNSSKIFLGTPFNGLYVSSDNGYGWTYSGNGLGYTQILTVYALGDTIFAGLSQTGAYVSVDNGVNWTTCNSGFPATINVNSFAVFGDTIWAGTSKGLWKRSINNLITSNFEQNINNTFYVYPNPTNGKFNITNENAIKSIEILNIFGKVIYNGKIDDYINKIEIDISSFSKGIYFIKVNNNEEIHFEKLILN